jgi:hypothetical protein
MEYEEKGSENHELREVSAVRWLLDEDRYRGDGAL